MIKSESGGLRETLKKTQGKHARKLKRRKRNNNCDCKDISVAAASRSLQNLAGLSRRSCG
jgi:hypothetical protein